MVKCRQRNNLQRNSIRIHNYQAGFLPAINLNSKQNFLFSLEFQQFFCSRQRLTFIQLQLVQSHDNHFVTVLIQNEHNKISYKPHSLANSIS